MDNRLRTILTRLVTGSLLFFLLLRVCEHATLSGLQAPPLFSVELDLTYWLFKLSRLPQVLTQHPFVSTLFDILLFAVGLLVFLFPLKRWLIGTFAGLLFIYCLTFDLYATHHLAQVYGFMVILLPFLVRDNKAFSLSWEGMRYYTCLIYVLAFVWKICLGDAFFNVQQGVVTFKLNLVDYMALNPQGTLTAVYEWFLRHPWILNTGAKTIVLLEGVMVIGFFTKKFDRILIWIPVVIHVATYFFSDVFFIELLVLDLSLLSPEQLNRLGLLLSFSEVKKTAGTEIPPR